MKPYELKRFYHPKMGKFVYKHKGSGIIVGNIFKPIRTMASSVAIPFPKKVIKSGVEHAGERAAEKSGDLIMRRLRGVKQKKLPTIKEKSTDMILNRLIPAQGMRKTK